MKKTKQKTKPVLCWIFDGASDNDTPGAPPPFFYLHSEDICHFAENCQVCHEREFAEAFEKGSMINSGTSVVE